MKKIITKLIYNWRHSEHDGEDYEIAEAGKKEVKNIIEEFHHIFTINYDDGTSKRVYNPNTVELKPQK